MSTGGCGGAFFFGKGKDGRRFCVCRLSGEAPARDSGLKAAKISSRLMAWLPFLVAGECRLVVKYIDGVEEDVDDLPLVVLDLGVAALEVGDPLDNILPAVLGPFQLRLQNTGFQFVPQVFQFLQPLPQIQPKGRQAPVRQPGQGQRLRAGLRPGVYVLVQPHHQTKKGRRTTRTDWAGAGRIEGISQRSADS